MAMGAGVVDIGLAATDQVWYASGATGLPAVQFTASHNPAQYNGVKFCLPHAAPITPDLMARIKALALAGDGSVAQGDGSLAQGDGSLARRVSWRCAGGVASGSARRFLALGRRNMK